MNSFLFRSNLEGRFQTNSAHTGATALKIELEVGDALTSAQSKFERRSPSTRGDTAHSLIRKVLSLYDYRSSNGFDVTNFVEEHRRNVDLVNERLSAQT